MNENGISLEELKREIRDMLLVCFEGSVLTDGTLIYMVLPSGQRFSVAVGEEAA